MYPEDTQKSGYQILQTSLLYHLIGISSSLAIQRLPHSYSLFRLTAENRMDILFKQLNKKCGSEDYQRDVFFRGL